MQLLKMMKTNNVLLASQNIIKIWHTFFLPKFNYQIFSLPHIFISNMGVKDVIEIIFSACSHWFRSKTYATVGN